MIEKYQYVLVTINVKQHTDLLICNTVYTYFDKNIMQRQRNVDINAWKF